MMKEYRLLDFVERWGITPRHSHQTVASHSFYVALYTSELCEMLEVDDSGRVLALDYALRHDATDAWESDIPGPAKRSLVDPAKQLVYHSMFAKGMNQLYASSITAGKTARVDALFIPDDNAHPVFAQRVAIKAIVKVADLIDEVFYLAFEQNLGNNMVRDLYRRELSRLDQAAIALAGEGFAAALMDVIGKQIARIGEEGAQIPSNDDDLVK